MIVKIEENKKRYLDLLLLADEQEEMIDLYLARGEMFALLDENHNALCVCVATREDGYVEIKNLATRPDCQRKGFARRMIEHVAKTMCAPGSVLMVGTGDSPLTIPFYEKCGFVRDHVIPNFFTEHYDHEIWEDGVLLKDMVYLKKIV